MKEMLDYDPLFVQRLINSPRPTRITFRWDDYFHPGCFDRRDDRISRVSPIGNK